MTDIADDVKDADMADNAYNAANADDAQVSSRRSLILLAVEYLRVYQDDTQGETRGLNPPITYETRRKLLKNRVTW